MAQSFRDLVVWQKAMRLAGLTYELSKSFPREDLYGLTSQMRRAAVSIPSNIAEGAGRLKTTEYMHFLGIARGSIFELLTQLTLARDFGYCTSNQLQEAEKLSNEVGKMISTLIESLRRSKLETTGSRPAQIFNTNTNH